LRNRLHRLDGPERLACRHMTSGIGQLDEDDVAELILGEIGDADFGNLAVEPNPLVVLRVFAICGIRHAHSKWGRGSFKQDIHDVSSSNDPRPHYTFVKGQRHDLRLRDATANVDLNLASGCGKGRRNVGHADGLLEKRRLCTARDLAHSIALMQHRVSPPRDSALEHLETNQRAREASLLLLEKTLAADEVTLPPADR